MNNLKNNKKHQFPDFIIVGAMKSGTTSLHNILASHPDIYIPQREIHFFDIDDITQHPDFFFFSDGKWYYPDLEKNSEKYLEWYGSFFSNAKVTQKIGEDSTTYLASNKAPARIVNLLPKVKIIIMLRDPASRTYSHYWHLVRTGRGIHTFEDSLRIMPGTLIQRSLYKDQIQRYLGYFPQENIHFILFEEFIQEINGCVNDTCKYLEVNSSKIDFDQIKTHYNAARVPKFPTLQLWWNQIMKNSSHPSYLDHLLNVPPEEKDTSTKIKKFLDRLYRKVNRQILNKPPEMNPATRQFLNQFFSHENEGLSELINKDINEFWYQA